MISTLLDRLFQRSNVPSGAKVKQRLKFILAHDRAAIEPQVFDNMRNEIMRVVSRYVELDEGSLDIRLESDKRMTALIANLPIRMVREQLPDLISLFDESNDVVSSAPAEQRDSSALEMDLSAEAALDAIADKEKAEDKGDQSTQITAESADTVEERTVEVGNKLRTAVNKPQSDQVDTAQVDDDSSQSTEFDGENLIEQDQVDQLELSLDVSTSMESLEIVVDPEL